MDDTSQLIVTGERVATLEAHDKDLYGNGREGRVTTVERTVDNLSRFR